VTPFLVLLAGPNGAGKTTLYQTRVAESFACPFINADMIQRDELGDLSMEASYRAAEIAAARRADLLKSGKSFATETVFSHPSKLTVVVDARRRGYRVVVMHVGVDSPDLSVARVRARAMEGGHDVPEEKVRDRYVRGQPLIRQAALLADLGMVYDNSILNTPPRLVLQFTDGRLVKAEEPFPRWITVCYAADLARRP